MTTLPDEFKSVIDDVKAERCYQREKWCMAFDDRNTLNDWVAYICHYAGRATEMHRGVEEQKSDMVKVATLAVAALEAVKRNGHFPPRHYEDAGGVF